MSNARGFRDSFRSYIPPWAANRLERSVGYRFLYSLIAPFDVMIQTALEGAQAAWPGKGTPTALPLIARMRGLLQGESETTDHFVARLLKWLETWTDAGSDVQLVTQIHEYLGNSPMVRVVTRAGNWVTIAADGTISRASAAWDWDSISNPERSGYWSDLWVIVYPCEWLVTAVGALVDSHELGIGHAVPRVAVQAILGLVAQWKGAHTRVRAIIWSYDATLFDPANMAAPGNPDGKWGEWTKYVAGVSTPARNTTCRYWIPDSEFKT
jgi:hypothetical protein